MKLEILMATMFRKNIEELELDKKNITSDLLIINQTNDNKQFFDDSIRMLNFKERGSSKSRNRAIENAKGDICLIADDDVIYKKNYEKIVLNAFKENPEADVITFQIETPNGKPFKKKYLQNERWHNQMTILKCASIEIAFRRESIIKNKIFLDDEFGLGSRYRVHDEIIFLMDCLKKGLRIKYIPIPIVIHPEESSGTDYNEHLIISKGAAFIRLFGIKGMLLNIVFAFRKLNEYKDKFTLNEFIKIIYKGSFDFIKTH